MVIKFYHNPLSPPGRAVHFVLKTLNIPHELIILDLTNKEHKSAEYLKTNPEGSAPLIDDNGLLIADSHAINIYLVSKYGKDDSLYPKNLDEQSKVNYFLFLDAGELFSTLKSTVLSFPITTVSTRTEEMVEKFEKAYNRVEVRLGNTKYAAGNSWTLADFSLVTTLTSAHEMVPISKDKFPLLSAYLKLCEETLPYYADINKTGLEDYKKYIESKNFRIDDS